MIPIVITEVQKQKDKVRKMIAHCRELDGTELVVLPVRLAGLGALAMVESMVSGPAVFH